MVQKFPDAHLFRRVILDDQEPLAAGLGVLLDLGQRRADAFGRGRLADVGECAARQSVLLVFVERDDLNRNVPRQRVVLQLAEHGPAEHIGQEHIERNRDGLELFGKLEGFRTARRDQNLKSLVARQIDQNPRIMRIVLDNQKNCISGIEI